MDLVQMLAQIRALNILDASLFGVALVLAIVLRFLRAYLKSVDDAHTLAAAFVLALFGGVANLMSRPFSFILVESFALFAVVLMLELLLRKLGDKLPFLPADDQYVKQKPTVAVEATIHVDQEEKKL